MSFSSRKSPRNVALVRLYDSVRADVIRSAFQLCGFNVRVTTTGIDPSALPCSDLVEAGIKWKYFFSKQRQRLLGRLTASRDDGNRR